MFSTLAAGVLNADAFHIGAAAADAEDRIIYNSATGALSYNSNGTGAGGMVQFAKVAPGLAMTNAEFFVSLTDGRSSTSLLISFAGEGKVSDLATTMWAYYIAAMIDIALRRFGRPSEVDGCPCRKSNPCVLAMQAAENRPAFDAPNRLNDASGRCVLARGQMRARRIVVPPENHARA